MVLLYHMQTKPEVLEWAGCGGVKVYNLHSPLHFIAILPEVSGDILAKVYSSLCACGHYNTSDNMTICTVSANRNN